MKLHKFRKFLSLFLSIGMILQLLTGASLGTNAVTAEAAEAIHTYYVGGENASNLNNGEAANVPLATVAAAAALIKQHGAGDYNIIVQGGTNETEQIVIGDSAGSPVNVTITSSCLSNDMTKSVSGSAILASATGSAIILRNPSNLRSMLLVKGGATLNLGDSTGTSPAVLYLDGGSSSTSTINGAASIVNIENNGRLNLYSKVTLQNNYNSSANGYEFGGAVRNEGNFTMYGGSIRNNKALSGGGVYNYGTFTLVGGSIQENSAERGGGVETIYGDFNMSGGTIIGNSSLQGGGVYIPSYCSGMTMTGGTITMNQAPTGGAIFVSGNNINLSGSASIPVAKDGSNDINLLDSKIMIKGVLSSTDKIRICKDAFIGVGANVLVGNPELLRASFSLFELSDDRFHIDSSGKVIFVAEVVTYYVGGVGASDSNAGLKGEAPFATLDKAVEVMNSSIGTIIIQGDTTISKTLYLSGDVTIKGDGIKHTIRLSSAPLAFSAFYIPSGTLTLGDSSNTVTQENMLIFDGSGQTLWDCIYIKDEATVTINSGIEFSNFTVNYSLIENDGRLNITSGSFKNNATKYLITNDGTFSMSGGDILLNTASKGIIYNLKKFSLSGGSITENMTTHGYAVNNLDTFHMSGGSLSSNTSIGVINSGDFTMSGGSINANHDSNQVYNSKSLVISGAAFVDSINMASNLAVLTIGGPLTSSNSIKFTEQQYYDNAVVLEGSAELLEAYYQKFVITDTADFYIGKDGKLHYTGTIKTYYVNSSSGSDTNSGTKEAPLATIQAATALVNKNDVCNILLQSDVALTSSIKIVGTVTIDTDGGCYTISRAGLTDSMVTITGKLLLGNPEGRGNDKAPTLTLDGSGNAVAAPIIRNDYILELYPGVLLKNNSATNSSYAGGVSSTGSFRMYGGIISNNTAANGSGGVYINTYASFLMNGGSIEKNSGNTGGIELAPQAEFTMNGGTIVENTAPFVAGVGALSAAETKKLVINGGEISSNTGTITGGILFMKKVTGTPGSAPMSTDYDNTFALNGGTIRDNKGVLSGIVMMADYNLGISKNVSITGDDRIYLIDSYTGIVSVNGPLSGGSEAIDISVVSLDQTAAPNDAFTSVLPVGRQVLTSGNGYTFTEEDVQKFTLSNADYGINIEGNIGAMIKASWVTITNATNSIYNGTTKTVNAAVTDGTKILVKDKDYSVAYLNNINVGTATAVIRGIGSYAGKVEKSFTILAAPTETPSSPETPSTAPTEAPSSPTTPTTAPTEAPSSPTAPTTAPTAVPVATPVPAGKDTITIDISEKYDTDTGKDIIIPITTDKLLENIQSSSTKQVAVTVNVPDKILNNGTSNTRIILEEATIEATKEAGKSLSVSIQDSKGKERYSWSFDRKELDDSDQKVTDVNLFLEVKSIKDVQGLSDILNENAPGLVISFAHDGVLPAQATVKIYVGNLSGVIPGGNIYLYHWNKETGKLDTLPYSSSYVVDADGYATINILHCSDYVVLTKKPASSVITSLLNQIQISVSRKIIYTGVKTSTAKMVVDLPATLERVSSIKAATSQPAIGGAVLSYRSSNSKVIKVNKKGILTAVGTGKANVITTITLYSGKTKTVKTPITVKEQQKQKD